MPLALCQSAWKQAWLRHNGVLTGYCSDCMSCLSFGLFMWIPKHWHHLDFAPRLNIWQINVFDHDVYVCMSPGCLWKHACVRCRRVWTAVWVWESEALGGHLQTERLFSQAPASHSPLTVPGSTLKTLAFPHADIFKETFEILQTCMLMHLIVRSDLKTSTKGLCGRVDLQREIYPARRSQRVGSSRAAHAPV